MTALGVQPQQQGLVNNDNGVLRKGARLPSSVAPKGPVIGDLWYNTAILALQVWNGSAWVGVASGGVGNVVTPGFEIYHPSGTPYIDFHNAANPAGDGGADFNVRFILSASNVMSILGTVNDVRFQSNVFRCGTYVPDNAWAQFGHKDRMNVDASSYQFMAHTNGSILMNASNSNTGQLVYNGNGILTFGADSVTGRGIAMNDHAIHNRGIGDNNHRIEYQSGVDAVNHTMNSNIRFASTSQYTIRFSVDGNVVAKFQDGNSATRLGSWPVNGVFGGLFSEVRLGQNGAHYLHMSAANDNNTFITCNAGGSSGAGAVFFRLGNNGTTIMTIGDANQGTGAGNICMGLPNGIAGDTVFRAGGSGQIGINVSSEKHKRDIRTLRDTPEKDAGVDNPVFKMRPVRFKWKDRDTEKNEGLINADEINSRHPNGVAGLIAEEVREICPDAVNVWPAKPEWHWQEGDTLPETDKLGQPILFKPATPEVITSIDNDRMVAYLVDAVQHLNEEKESLKLEIKSLKEKVK